MKIGRRTFLQGAGVAVSAGLLAPGRVLAAADAAAPAKALAGDMPWGMTFVTIRRGREQGLGIKTDRGILDVKRTEAVFKQKAPTTIDEAFQRGGGQALAAWLSGRGTARLTGSGSPRTSWSTGPA